MLHNIIDFVRSLVDPERLIQLLTPLLNSWLGYAALFGIVFSDQPDVFPDVLAAKPPW